MTISDGGLGNVTVETLLVEEDVSIVVSEGVTGIVGGNRTG